MDFFKSHRLDSDDDDVQKSNGWCSDGTTFAWCILVSVMDLQCSQVLNQLRRALAAALAKSGQLRWGCGGGWVGSQLIYWLSCVLVALLVGSSQLAPGTTCPTS